MVKRFFSQAWLYAKGRQAAFRWEEFLLLDAGYPFLTLVFYCLLAAYSFQTWNLSHWVAGNSLLLCTNICVFQLGGAFNGERYYGRLRSIVTSPTALLEVVLESAFFPMLLSAVTVLAGFLLGSLIFGVRLAALQPGLAMAVILAAMFAASGLGLLLSACSLLGDGMHFLLNVVSYVLMICTGAQFPVTQLPPVFQWVSRLLPLTRGIAAMDLLLAGETGQILPLLLGEAAVGLGYCALAALVIGAAARSAVRRGSLELF